MSEALFICDICDGIFPDTCPKCPDRGTGRGVTVQHIKDELRACSKIGDVNAIAKHYGRHVALLEREGGEARTMAIQIKNLAAYRRSMIGESWRPQETARR